MEAAEQTMGNDRDAEDKCTNQLRRGSTLHAEAARPNSSESRTSSRRELKEDTPRGLGWGGVGGGAAKRRPSERYPRGRRRGTGVFFLLKQKPYRDSEEYHRNYLAKAQYELQLPSMCPAAGRARCAVLEFGQGSMRRGARMQPAERKKRQGEHGGMMMPRPNAHGGKVGITAAYWQNVTVWARSGGLQNELRIHSARSA